MKTVRHSKRRLAQINYLQNSGTYLILEFNILQFGVVYTSDEAHPQNIYTNKWELSSHEVECTFLLKAMEWNKSTEPFMVTIEQNYS